MNDTGGNDMTARLAHFLRFVIATVLCLSCMHTFAPAGPASPWAISDLDVPYVPTPDKVVAAMLTLAEIRDGDVVYDPACGDGRLVIAAAKQHNVRCLGTDIDPNRVEESRANAEHAKVTDRVNFSEKNLFDADFRGVNVVLIYLLPDINLKLRPKLLTELKPGARIVSHAFDMGEWQPDRTVRADKATIYYWMVPANVSGEWQASRTGRAGRQTFSLTLSQQYQEVQGKLIQGRVEQPLKNVRLTGDQLTFAIRDQDGEDAWFNGRIAGNRISGSIEKSRPGAATRWEAERDATTKVPFDQPVIRVKGVGR